MKAEVETDPKRIAEFKARMATYDRDMDALMARRPELLAAHPNEWVTIHDGRVFHDLSIDDMFEQLEAAGIDPGNVPREFLGKDRPPLLL